MNVLKKSTILQKVLITEVCNNESYSDFWKAPCSDMEKLASHELDKYELKMHTICVFIFNKCEYIPRM
jgi:hypothetical protein